jgi:hypothetical protein
MQRNSSQTYYAEKYRSVTVNPKRRYRYLQD